MTEEMKTNDASRYVVLRMGDGDGPGAWTTMAIESSEGEAKKKAEGFAREDTAGYLWGVYQKVATARKTEVIEWKGAAR